MVNEIRAGIYNRCSNEAKDRDTLKNQLEDNIQTCKRNGWLYEVFTDDGVGVTKRLDGPQFQRLMAKVKAGEINNVVVWEPDRFGRNLSEALKNAEQYLKPYGCKITMDRRLLDLDDPHDYAQFCREQIDAELDAKKIAKRTIRTKIGRIKDNLLTQGKPPYGYRWVNKKMAESGNTNDAIGAHEIEREVDNVRRVFDLFTQGMSQAEISRTLKLNEPLVRRILRTPCYWTGKHNIKFEVKPYMVKILNDDEISEPCMLFGEVTMPIIVDLDLAEAAQRRIQSQQTKANMGRKAKHPHLLKGRLICDVCGSRTHIRNPRIKGKLYEYYYHDCKDGKGVHLPAPEWDELFWSQIVHAANNPDLFVRSIQALQNTDHKADMEYLVGMRENLLKQAKIFDRRKKNYIEQLGDAMNSEIRKDVMATLESLYGEIEQLKFELKRTEQEIENLEKLSRASESGSLLTKIKALKLREKMTDEEKHEAIEKLEIVIRFKPLRSLILPVDGSGMKRTTLPVASPVAEYAELWKKPKFREAIKKLGGLPVRAEGLIELDFNERLHTL